MLIMLLAQTIAPPAGVIPAPPPPPSAMPRPMMVAEDRVAQPRIRVAIVLRGGGALLWEGSLWVAPRSTSSWRQAVQQPAPTSCGYRSADMRQEEVGVQLSPGYSGFSSADGNARFDQTSVTVRWSRAEEGECGSRTVELRQTVSLEDRKPIVLRGDGGLTIELRRQ